MKTEWKILFDTPCIQKLSIHNEFIAIARLSFLQFLRIVESVEEQIEAYQLWLHLEKQLWLYIEK